MKYPNPLYILFLFLLACSNPTSKTSEDQLTSKEKILFDTKPIVETGKTVGLACRGYKYTHLHAFEEYVAMIHVAKATLIEEVKANSKYQDEELIEKALKDLDFVRKSKITEAPLRQQTLAFWQLVVNIIEAS